MKKTIGSIMMAGMVAVGLQSCGSVQQENDGFAYSDERFADLQMLRYKVEGFEDLSLKQKTFIYHLQEAALWGRDILWDQNGVQNLNIRRVLEAVYADGNVDKNNKEYAGFEVYLKRVWFSNGIHHHYGSEKFVPGFSEKWLREQVKGTGLKMEAKELDAVCEAIFNPNVMQKRVNLAEGVDLIKTSACNYYQGVTQAEAEEFYEKMKAESDTLHPVMFGMNSTLRASTPRPTSTEGKAAPLPTSPEGEECLAGSENGRWINGKWIYEEKWTTKGKYGDKLKKIVENLKLARPFAEDEKQQVVIDKLVKFYETGDLKTFDEYSIAWVENTEPMVDFVNGFIECYGDPLGLKCSWESIVNFKDLEATKRTETLSKNAQWFEDNSPVDKAFKKDKVKGISAKVINAAILAGDLYPSTAIGINLPNSDWVRAEHGSKSVTIGNLTDAYNKAAKGNGFNDEFVYSKEEIELIEKYGDVCDDLHTDLHECLGHGSGKLLEGVDGDSLKAYGSTIEEARADLFALYYLPDAKLVELGLTPDTEAYKASYYTQMMNGLMTQLVRINPGNEIEEAHMRNRAIIARWALERAKTTLPSSTEGKAAPLPTSPEGEECRPAVELVKKDGKTFVKINDYEKLREIFGELLAEIQRIKSTGDFKAAQALVENYGVKIDSKLHKEILDRYEHLNIAPYKGFINPRYTAVKDADGNITDVTVDYSEGYAEQMMRYSREY